MNNYIYNKLKLLTKRQLEDILYRYGFAIYGNESNEDLCALIESQITAGIISECDVLGNKINGVI